MKIDYNKYNAHIVGSVIYKYSTGTIEEYELIYDIAFDHEPTEQEIIEGYKK